MSTRMRLVLVGVLLAGWSGAARAQAASPDSLLAMACEGGGGMADGLLLVEFGGGVDPAQRATMVKEAGAVLADAGEDANLAYAVLPPGTRTDLAADRLIRLAGVQSVGEVACPAAPAAPAATVPAAAAGPDSTRRDTTARTDTTARPPAAGSAGAPPAPSDTARQSSPVGTPPAATPLDSVPAAVPDTTPGVAPADSVAQSPGPA
jgi:hypothetical protein